MLALAASVLSGHCYGALPGTIQKFVFEVVVCFLGILYVAVVQLRALKVLVLANKRRSFKKSDPGSAQRLFHLDLSTPNRKLLNVLLMLSWVTSEWISSLGGSLVVFFTRVVDVFVFANRQ